MSKQNQAFINIYKQHLAHSVSDQIKQDFARAVQKDPELREDYQAHGELIQLLNALPRLPDDPDFAIQVQRRIARRQRARRRSRRQHNNSTTGVGAITTLVTLLVVVAIALATHPVSQQVNTLAMAQQPQAGKVLFLDVTTGVTPLRASLDSMQNARIISGWKMLPDGPHVDIRSDRLTQFLFTVSKLGALQISARPEPLDTQDKRADQQITLRLQIEFSR